MHNQWAVFSNGCRCDAFDWRIFFDDDGRDNYGVTLSRLLCLRPGCASGGFASFRSATQFLIGHRKPSNSPYSLPELWQGNACLWVESENSFQYIVASLRNRQNSGKKVWILDISTKSIVVCTCLSPRIASTSKVYKDDTQRPNVVLTGSIRPDPLKYTPVAFWKCRIRHKPRSSLECAYQDSCSRNFHNRSRGTWRHW